MAERQLSMTNERPSTSITKAKITEIKEIVSVSRRTIVREIAIKAYRWDHVGKWHYLLRCQRASKKHLLSVISGGKYLSPVWSLRWSHLAKIVGKHLLSWLHGAYRQWNLLRLIFNLIAQKCTEISWNLAFWRNNFACWKMKHTKRHLGWQIGNEWKRFCMFEWTMQWINAYVPVHWAHTVAKLVSNTFTIKLEPFISREQMFGKLELECLHRNMHDQRPDK